MHAYLDLEAVHHTEPLSRAEFCYTASQTELALSNRLRSF